MIPILIGLMSALIFSIVTYMMYGLEGVMLRDWIDQVFIGMISVGVVIGVINAIWHCLPCQLSKILHSSKLTDTWCGTCNQ